MSLDQYGFRWRNDDGSESSATWKATQNTNVSLPLDTPVRLRVGVDVSSDPGPGDSYWRLEAKKTTAGDWFEVQPTAGANKAIILSATGNIAAGGENTSAQLAAPSGKTTANFANGRMWDDETGQDVVSVANGKYTEFEWCVKADSGNGASISDLYDFRVTRKAVVIAQQVALAGLFTGGNSGDGDCIQVDDANSIGSTTWNVPADATQVIYTIAWAKTSGLGVPSTPDFKLGSQSLTQRASHSVDSTATVGTYIYVLDNPPTGNQAITGTWSGGTFDMYVGAIALKNTNGINTDDTRTAVDTTSITAPSDVNGATIAVFGVDGSTPTMNFNKIWDNSAFGPGGGSTYQLGGTSNVHTFTGAGGIHQSLCSIHSVAA